MTVDVVIRNVTDLEEVTVTVLETASIRELKEILAERVERPELLEVGEFFRILPDGSIAPIKETMKVGVRRLLGFKGCPLHPAPPERLVSLDDFLEFDADEEVLGSPRSVKACSLEGVAPEDLIWVPPESYQQPNIEPRIAELWYDFFEAFRQDALKATRATRQMLIAEEEGNLELTRQEGTRIAATGGNWCGALAHSHYPSMKEFFRERNEMCHIDRVYRGATKPYRPNLKGSRYFSNSATFQDEDPVLAGDTADDAAGKLNGLLSYYHRIPNSKSFVEEQSLKTKATGVVQYACDAEKLHLDQAEFRRLLDCRIETVEAQVAIIDHEIQQRNAIRRDCDMRDHESRPPKTELEAQDRLVPPPARPGGGVQAFLGMREERPRRLQPPVLLKAPQAQPTHADRRQLNDTGNPRLEKGKFEAIRHKS